MKRLHYWRRLVPLIGLLLLATTQLTHALSDPTLPQQYSVQVSATVQASPAQITLSWPAYTLGNPDPNSSNHIIYRKSLSSSTWSQIGTVGITTNSFTDSSVVVGQGYDYKIVRNPSDANSKYGFVYAGIELTIPDYRGKLLLLVDNRYTISLASELARLKQDMVGDGWEVIQKDVSASDTVVNIRGVIQAEYAKDPTNVRAVLLFGDIPTPYSGDITPDGHPENHKGAWSADVYYADVDGTWTDTTVTSTSSAFSQNHNVPGDGKFDQSFLSEVSDVELEVGRVDLSRMWSFSSKTEEQLLRQYLDKDHNFRHGLLPVERRGLVEENFSGFGYGYLAYSSWANFAPFFGAANTIDTDWSTMTTDSYLWAYGSGGGWFNSASNIAGSWDFANNQYKVIFTMLLGSYFGEWDSDDNLLRAVLAMETYGLTAVWSGIPDWYFQHMALGETIGFSNKLSQNQAGIVYDSPTFEAQGVHMALMGDPTLRMHVVLPPANASVAPNPTQGVDVSWAASSDTIVGYHVYSAATSDGPFTRLTTNPVMTTSYTDTRRAEPRTYMIRAVKLETSSSGSYYNMSQGIFVDSTITAPPIAPAAFLAIVINGVEVRWNEVTTDINQDVTTTTSYNVYRDSDPYFVPDTVWTTATPPFGNPVSVPDNPNGNQFYAVTAVNTNGESAYLSRIGRFAFAIFPGQ
ncbi:MAG: hypothetical protein AAF614_37040 [Chloroflexota bacterium]